MRENQGIDIADIAAVGRQPHAGLPPADAGVKQEADAIGLNVDRVSVRPRLQ
jgi:hypothetical protein